MNNEINQVKLLAHIKQVAQDNALDIHKVTAILANSFKKVYLREFVDNKIDVKIDLESGKINMWRYLKVVEDDFFYGEGMGDEDDETLIPLSKAQKIAKLKNIEINLGDSIKKAISINDFDKRTVRNILSIFKQLTIEAVNKNICDKWSKYKHQVLEGKVEKIDDLNGKDIRGAIIVLTSEEGETTKAYITKHELIQTVDRSGNRIYEILNTDSTYLFYVKDVHEFSSGWPVNLSRTHPEIVKHLLKIHISEVADGSIEIKNIARIAGVKTKVFVHSRSLSIDPVGACLGPKARRLKVISDLLLNEKIDIIEWSENPVKNIVNAVVPGRVLGYSVIDENSKEIILVTNEDNYLSAIGKKGINVKLASLLTGWSIDIKNLATANEENINFKSMDSLNEDMPTNVSERIYRMHKKGKDEILRQFNEISDEEIDDFNEEEDDFHQTPK